MKSLWIMLLAAVVVMGQSKNQPQLTVFNTNSAACAWITSVFPTACRQNVMAILYPLPTDADVVKFTMTYLDQSGVQHQDQQIVAVSGPSAVYMLPGDNLIVLGITAVVETPVQTISINAQ